MLKPKYKSRNSRSLPKSIIGTENTVVLSTLDNYIKIFEINSLISISVFNKTMSFLNQISETSLVRIDLEDIYPTDNGTVNLDFVVDADNVFSVEIGKDDIGFFSEIDGDVVSYCESVNDSQTPIDFNEELNNFFVTVGTKS